MNLGTEKYRLSIPFLSIALAILGFCTYAGAQNRCDDIDGATALYNKFLATYMGDRSKAEQAIVSAEEYLKLYSQCPDSEEITEYLTKAIPLLKAKIRANPTKAEALVYLNEILSDAVGTFRTPFSTLPSFYYTRVSASNVGDNRIRISTTRATSMNDPGPYRCQTYGVIEQDQIFDLAQANDIKLAPESANASAGLLIVTFKSSGVLVSTKAWTYTDYNSRNGVCSGWKLNTDKQENVKEAAIMFRANSMEPYEEDGTIYYKESSTASRLEALVRRLSRNP